MENTAKNRKQSNILVRFLREWGIFLAIIILAILSRVFIWSLVVVDGHSMDPTLADKERLVLVKTATVKRFDIVVARETSTTNGSSSSKDIVKRVIGMPGDDIKFDHDKLTINGQSYQEPYLKDFQKQLADGQLEKTYGAYPLTSALDSTTRSFFVTLAQKTQAFTTTSTGAATFEVKVPQGEYYLMGDNRVVSMDSRAVGPFKKSQILGVAKLRVWPLNKISTLK